jgi:predicted esterase
MNRNFKVKGMNKLKIFISSSLLLFSIIFIGLLVFKKAIKSEIELHHLELVKKKYYVNQMNLNFFKSRDNKIKKLFVVPEGDIKPVYMRVMNRALLGSINLEILDSKQKSVFELKGKNINYDLNLFLEGGEYELVIDLSSAIFNAINYGFNGNIWWVWELDENTYTKTVPQNHDNFSWPYLLYTPETIQSPSLLVIPNNTGVPSDIYKIHEADAREKMIRFKKLADSLGTPLLVPIFPRPRLDWTIYTHALDRDSLKTMKDKLERLDLQLIEMIRDAQSQFNNKGIQIEEKVFMYGFSASAMFVNRFAILHPEKVKAVACGAPGGWPIAPVSMFEGYLLPYPVGIADVFRLAGSDVNMDLYKEIPQFMFLGAEDFNDSVQNNDSYDKEHRDLIFKLFGDNIQKRWKLAEDIYNSTGCNSHFVTYKGVGHKINQKIMDDVVKFFASHSFNLRED